MSPNVEPLAAVIVELTVVVPVTSRFPVLTIPVVVNALSLKFISLLESVILPFPRVKLPIDEPVLALIVELN